MPYMVLTGTFHIKGKRPDGDTVSFRPDDPDLWLNKDWLYTTRNRLPKSNRQGDVNIRFEAVDALETHYRGKRWLPEFGQPEEFALAARDTMLNNLGFDAEDITWTEYGTATEAPDGKPGYIATNGIDPYGRVIGFVFKGTPPTENGNPYFYLRSNHLRQSVNFTLARQGLVYPTFYNGLYPSLRETVAEACLQAREENLGLWPKDKSLTGVAIPDSTNLNPITSKHLVMPKLFRRLVTHLSQNGALSNFRAYLYEKKDDTIHVPRAEMASLVRYIKVRDGVVSLKFPPEELVFVAG